MCFPHLIKQKKRQMNIEEDFKNLHKIFYTTLEDFAQFLWEKKFKQSSKQKNLLLTWAGGLREYRARFTSLELQKKALEWWTNEIFS